MTSSYRCPETSLRIDTNSWERGEERRGGRVRNEDDEKAQTETVWETYVFDSAQVLNVTNSHHRNDRDECIAGTDTGTDREGLPARRQAGLGTAIT
jgi:hypothetical protein